MDYPPGKAPLAILIMAVISGSLLIIFPPKKSEAQQRADAYQQAEGKPADVIEVWTFADSHFQAYKKVAPSFESAKPGTVVDVQYVHQRAVTSRLRSAFASDLDVPNAAEVEISLAGTFFLGPLRDIGFIDLTEELNKPRADGPPWIERVVRTRFTPYTSRRRGADGTMQDHIFGIPHDVHPVMLGYRRDVFEAHGIDAEKLTTWDEFIAAGRQLMKKLNSGSQIDHYLIDLSDTAYGDIEVLLFQRDGGYFDPEGKVRMDDEIAVETLCWYVPLVAGPERVANTIGWNWELTEKSAQKDYLLSFLAPDWKTRYYERFVPAGKGKYALMPLPASKPGGRRTSTYGGTMMGFTKKNAISFEKSFQLGLMLYFDIDSRVEQFKDTNILPPIREAWKNPAFAAPNEYWSNQPLGQLYAQQADQTPAQYSSPYIQLAKNKLSEALCDAVKFYKDNGNNGFNEFVRKRLKSSADEVRLQMTLNPYQ